MKRVLALLLSAALLFTLAACKTIKDPDITTKPDPSAETTTGPEGPSLPGFAGVTANWAWGVSNGSGDGPATHLALTGYAKDCDFAKLDLAIGPFGQAKVSYAGEKKGDDSIEPWYFADYERVTGPYFAFEKPIDVTTWQPVFFLVDSSAVGEGLAPLRQSERFAGGGDDAPYYPAASYEDIAKAELLHPGRAIEESQLLAEADDARVCMFRYENKPEEGLFALVCFDGAKVLSIDYTTDYVDEDGAGWRVDLEPDNVGLLEPVLLCRTTEGILLIVTWVAPEGRLELILREKGGALEEFSLGGWGYDSWDDEYYLDEYEEE